MLSKCSRSGAMLQAHVVYFWYCFLASDISAPPPTLLVFIRQNSQGKEIRVH